MKKKLFFTMLYIVMAQLSIAQKKTIINIKFENFKDSVIRLSIPVVDGKFERKSVHEYISEKNDGNFHFDFPLKNSATISIYSNIIGSLIFIPGTFTILINPGDSLNFILRDNKLGLTNMEISGRGSEKLNMIKAVANKVNSSHLFTKSYRKQSITERFLEVDRSLDIIDSMFNMNPQKLTRDFRLAKAQLVNQTLDALISQSVDQYDDSVATLFKKFIVNKNRINPLLDSLTIEHFGGMHVLPYYIYLSNMDELGDRYDLFRYRYPLEYSSLVQKEFGRFSFVRDYLLSDNTMSIFRNNWYSKISKDTYKLYVSKVNRNSRYFQIVVNEFKRLKDVLKPGSPFYNFNLPDTNGVNHRLDDLRGKIVILDFWFTGCGACKTLATQLSKIEPQFKSHQIQFVSISVDKTLPVWKRGIGIYSVGSALQLYTEGKRYDHPIIKFGNINAFPTLIVLDREGRIVGIPPHPVTDPKGFKEYIMKCL
ncbi:hypothetical protein DBR39_18850 [Chryseobacterium sp. KBW03]|uniref:TlpA family protein disulfide reductase n=1 Tax=Chryseobacterium sp. KBW03 TaxID=2153362 RepID=UPI000F5A97DB|nr:TlpA disulfide reductase family protein [Chryseobacterium sp. KBW03]RQO35377.1 hypothetical protein DBR39_18850 [Chryseobacterium sp. KBW03]